MATPVVGCGFECGITGPHWTISGGESITTTNPLTGARSLLINPTGGGQSAQSALTFTGGVHVFRFRVKWSTLPNANVMIGAIGLGPGAWFNASDNKIYAYISSFGPSGISVTTGVEYVIDVKVNTSANPWTVDVQVNGAACGQQTSATAANTTAQAIFLGADNNGNTSSALFDDFVWSITAADYPIGTGYIYAFPPTADGAHNIAGADDFERGNTATDILNSTTTAYQLIDDLPLKTAVNAADNIQATAPGASDYVEIVFGPAAGGLTPSVGPRSIEVIVAYHQVATSQGSMRLALNDNGTLDDVLNISAAAGVTTIRYARKHYSDPPSAATSWTTASGNGNFNNLRMRFFSADANPDQNWDGALIEAEFASPIGRSLSANQGSFALTGQATALQRARLMPAAQGAIALSGQAVAFAKGRRMIADAGAFTLTGQAVTLTKSGAAGAFPSTGILDTFNRANEGPPPSSNWTTAWRPSTTGFKVNSNVCFPSAGGDNSTYWNNSFGPNVEVYAILASAVGGSYCGISARLINPGTANVCGYELVCFGNQIYFLRFDNNVQTQLGATISQTFSAGDAIGMSIVGSTISAYYKVGGGAWTLVGTRTDTTYSGAGKIGLRTESINFDDFGGGTITTGYTMAAAQGSFNALGQAASLLTARRVNAGQGSFTTTGSATNLLRLRRFDAAAASFNYLGQATSLRRERLLTANPTSFALSGPTTLLRFARRLTAPAQPFVLTGTNTGLLRALRLPVSTGPIVLTGLAVNLKRQRLLAATGAFTLTGNATSFSKVRGITASLGAYTVSGNAAVLRQTYLALPGGMGQFVFTGRNVNFLSTRALTITIAPGSFVISGQSAALARGRGFTASAGLFDLAGRPAQLQRGKRIFSAGGSLVLTGTGPMLLTVRRLAVVFGSYNYLGGASGLLQARRLAIGGAIFTLTGPAQAMQLAHRMLAPSGSLVLTGTAPMLRTGHRLAVALGSYNYLGGASGLLQARRLAIGAASFTLTGTAQAMQLAHRMLATSGSFLVTGFGVREPTAIGPPLFISVGAGGLYLGSGGAASLLVGSDGRGSLAISTTRGSDLFLFSSNAAALETEF